MLSGYLGELLITTGFSSLKQKQYLHGRKMGVALGRAQGAGEPSFAEG